MSGLDARGCDLLYIVLSSRSVITTRPPVGIFANISSSSALVVCWTSKISVLSLKYRDNHLGLQLRSLEEGKVDWMNYDIASLGLSC